MILAHVSALLIATTFAFYIGRRIIILLPSFFIFAGTYSYIMVSLLPEGIKDNQAIEYTMLSTISVLCAFSFGTLLKYKKYIILPIPVIIIICSVNYDIIFKWFGDDIVSFFTAPSRIEQSDSFTTYHYRFLPKKEVRIPRSLGEAHSEIDKIFKKNKIDVSKYDPVEFHFGFGMSIRNEWGLWSGKSQLSKQLKTFGFSHPDDMSGFIMSSYFVRNRKQREDRFDSLTFYAEIIDSLLLNENLKTK